MDTGKICTNCLRETMVDGVCTSCGKRIEEHPPRLPDTLPEGYILRNQYVLGRIIGKGGFGITYLARDIWQNRRVIVKELYPHNDVQRGASGTVVVPLAGQEAFFAKCRERFRQEAQVLESFRQEPDIVDVYDMITENNTEYYAMEYLSGWDLRTTAMQKGRVGWNELSGYVKSILRTLNLLHTKNLIHRDISPDNIFLVSNTEAKLIDFGSVRCYTDGRGLTTVLKQVYAPVEQYFTNGEQGPWTDIYSLSATIYHVVSGRKPPQAPSRVSQSGADPLVPIEKYCPELPPHVAAAIMKGMSVRHEDRFQNAKEMAAALFPGEDIFIIPTPRPKPDPDPPKPVPDPPRPDPDPPRPDPDPPRPDPIPPAPPVPANSGGILSRFIREISNFFRALFGHKKSRMVTCTGGIYQGSVLIVEEDAVMTIGRLPTCNISYPQDSKGISRIQLTFRCETDGTLIAVDGSTYGTLLNGMKMVKKNWYRLDSGATLSFAGETWRVE